MFGYVFFDYGLHEFYEFLPCGQKVLCVIIISTPNGKFVKFV